jgi:hypothetical protein
MLLLLICICFMNCVPALAQSSQDSAEQRTNSQKKWSSGDDQSADLNGRGEKKMLQDTGGKSGTQELEGIVQKQKLKDTIKPQKHTAPEINTLCGESSCCQLSFW